MIEGLTFDESTHTYYYQGNKVPGVTGCLENVGLSDFSMVPFDVLEQAQELGTEVHKIIEMSNKGLELPSCSDEAMARLLQYDQFVHDLGVEVVESEKIIFNKKYMYAGTLDLVAVLTKSTRSTGPCIIDFKTGGKSMAHPIQLSAYEYGYKTDKRSSLDTYTLYLENDDYKLEGPFRSRQYFDVFLSALTVCNYKGAQS